MGGMIYPVRKQDGNMPNNVFMMPPILSLLGDRQGDKQSTVRFPKLWKEPGTKKPDINIEVYQQKITLGIKVN